MPVAWRATAIGLIAKTRRPEARRQVTRSPREVLIAIGIGLCGLSPCSASSRSRSWKPAASSLILGLPSSRASESTIATSGWSSAQSIPRVTCMRAPFRAFTVHAASSRGGITRRPHSSATGAPPHQPSVAPAVPKASLSRRASWLRPTGRWPCERLGPRHRTAAESPTAGAARASLLSVRSQALHTRQTSRSAPARTDPAAALDAHGAYSSRAVRASAKTRYPGSDPRPGGAAQPPVSARPHGWQTARLRPRCRQAAQHSRGVHQPPRTAARRRQERFDLRHAGASTVRRT